jgi:hypothetical protein
MYLDRNGELLAKAENICFFVGWLRKKRQKEKKGRGKG